MIKYDQGDGQGVSQVDDQCDVEKDFHLVIFLVTSQTRHILCLIYLDDYDDDGYHQDDHGDDGEDFHLVIFLVTSQTRHILSRGNSFFLAVL